MQTHKVFLRSEVDITNIKLSINYFELTLIKLTDDLKEKRSLSLEDWRWILEKGEVKKALVLLGQKERKVVTIWEIARI